MKRLFTLIFFFSFMAHSFSQNIAISENAQWVIEYVTGGSFADIDYTYFKTNGDTTINSILYKKLYKMPVHQTNAYDFTPDGPITYAYAFRNDGNNRAYIYPFNDTIEHLWYDFNLSIGDTLSQVNPWYSYFNNFYVDTVKVVAIDSVQMCNTWYRQFHFNSTQIPNLVQGVGFTGDLINYNWEYFEFAAYPVFFAENNDCPINILSVSEGEMEQKTLVIYPNPVSDFIYLDYSESNRKDIRKITIYDLAGKNVLELDIKNSGNKINIPANLPEGNYLIQVDYENEREIQKLVILR
jgi:hypothetical protein